MEHDSQRRSSDELVGAKGPRPFQIEPKPRTVTLVVHCDVKSQGSIRTGSAQAKPLERSAEARLEETVGLAQAIDLDIADAFILPVNKVRPATFLGAGKVEEFKGIVAATGAEVVVVNAPLSPVQQRNLEKAWNTKILDRTGLILEIFGARARTREGRLQVDLAHLTYQKSRLVRTWTHLERQRGALGFVGGPGETQIEADRRMIQERINRLQGQLETVKKTRELQRASRRKVPYPIVALVGYTNAGKSSLFNRMASATVMAEDLLFATLDPTMREVTLPNGKSIVLSDTVGFISELPTNLIAAFRATLEEVLEADVIVHVRDAAHEDAAAQGRDVDEVLHQLGVDDLRRQQIIEVWNKVDLLDAETRATLEHQASRSQQTIVLASAKTGEGIDRLTDVLGEALSASDREMTVHVTPENGSGLHWLYQNTQVLERDDCDDGSSRLQVRVPHEKVGVLERRGIEVVEQA